MATTVRKTDGGSYPGSQPVKDVKYKTSTALYGRSGTGKTTLSATWPKPILYLNIKDNGSDSIADEDDIDVVHIETAKDLLDLILWCTERAKKGKLKYKTIVLDTMTQLQAILVKELGVNKKLAGKGKKRPGDFGTLTKQDWGSIAGDLKAVVMDIRNLPVESVFIAQERAFNLGDDDDDGLDVLAPEVGPRLMPSVKDDLNASVSIIGNTFIRVKVSKDKVDGKTVRTVKKLYCLRLGPNEVYTTKIRKPKGIKAPDYIVDPSFKKLKSITKGKE
jgi:hypothetical protein